LKQEIKKAYGIRIKPSVVKKIIKKYGSLTEFLNGKIKNDRKLD